VKARDEIEDLDHSSQRKQNGDQVVDGPITCVPPD
jgi:hypothetical protein